MTFRKNIRIGIMWNSTAKLFEQSFHLLFSILLARLIAPSAFGLIAMAIFFTAGAGLFVELGLGTAVIQRENLNQDHLNSVFWMNVLTGFLGMIVCYAGAGQIAAFYKEPILIPIAKALSLNFITGSFAIVPRALLYRNMKFNRSAQIDMFISLIGGLCAVIFALRGAGVWSLVARSILVTALTSTLLFHQSEFRPQFKFSFSAIKDIFRYGLYLSGFNFVNYLHRQGDNLIIGRLLGAHPLGIYDLAYQLMLFPITHIISPISNVMISAFSSIQKDKNRIKEIYLRMNGVICLVSFPILIAFLIMADYIILTIFGNAWQTAVLPLRILSIAGLVGIVCNPIGLIYISQGATDKFFKWGLFGTFFLVSGILIGAVIGRTIMSVAIGYMIANLIILYPCIQWGGKLVEITFADVLKVAGPILSVNILMGCAMTGIRLLVGVHNPLAMLGIETMAALLIYFSLIKFFKIRALDDLIGFIKERVEP